MNRTSRKLSTGIESLDKALGGGIPIPSTVEIVGLVGSAMAEYRGLDPQQALEKTTYVRTREWKQLVRVLRGSKAKLLIVDSLSWLFRGAENRKEAYMLRSIMYSILALAVEWALKNRSVFVFTSHGYKNRSYGDPYLSLFSLLRLRTIRERESLRIFCCGREFRATITEGGVLEAD